VLPAPVVVEFDWLCSSRGFPEIALVLLDDILGGAYTVTALTSQDHARCREVMARYADADIGIVDAAVLAIVERLNETKVATLDGKHFRFLRPKHVSALHLLPS